MRPWCANKADILSFMPGFIAQFGHVQHPRVLSGARVWVAWRNAHLRRASCELGGCRGVIGRLVFDHCHDHGWVRGVLCNGHNIQIGHLEAVKAIEGVSLDLGCTVYAAWLARCPDCAGQAPDPPRGVFAAPIGMAVPWIRDALRTAEQGSAALVSVARGSGTTAHLTADGDATLCGRVVGSMRQANPDQPRCRRCADAAGQLPGKVAAAREAIEDARQRGLIPVPVT